MRKTMRSLWGAAVVLALVVGCGDDRPPPAPRVTTVSPNDAASAPAPINDGTSQVAAQTDEPEATPARPLTTTATPQVVQPASRGPDLTAIRTQLEELRSLQFLHDVEMDFQSRDAFGAMVGQGVDAELGDDDGRDREAGLERLGVLGSDVDLASAYSDAMTSQVSGWYDPDDGRFHLIGDLEDRKSIDMTAAHELVHALQDQHFGLADRQENAQFADDGTRNDDALFAIRSLVEGEATLVQLAWMSTEMGNETADERLAAGGLFSGILAGLEMTRLVEFAQQQVEDMDEDDGLFAQMGALADIDPYVAEPMMGAYMRGAWFVHHVRKAGGWDAVSALYDDPPTTAEHILHPKRFAKERDAPTPVRLPGLPMVDAELWRVADTAIHGELYLQMLLRRNGVNPIVAFRACSGWDGDVYRAWRNASGDAAIVLATTWDTEKDAGQFLAAYRDVIAAKYPEHVPDESATPDSGSYGIAPGGTSHGVAVRRGREVFVVEGFDAAVTSAVLEQLRAMSVDHVD